MSAMDLGVTVEFWLDDEPRSGPLGVPVGMVLYSQGERVLGWNEATGEPRGLYCGIGHCYECRMEINGVRDRRACLVPLAAGLRVRRQPPPPPLVFEADLGAGGSESQARGWP